MAKPHYVPKNYIMNYQLNRKFFLHTYRNKIWKSALIRLTQF